MSLYFILTQNEDLFTMKMIFVLEICYSKLCAIVRTMQTKTFTLKEFLASERDSEDFAFLVKQGKLYLFHETTLVKQGTNKNKSMNYTLFLWLEQDNRIIYLAQKESDRVFVLAIFDLYEAIQTKIDTLREALKEEAEAVNYSYGAYNEQDFFNPSEYCSDYSTDINIPLGEDEVNRRIRYVHDMLADSITVDMLNDRELTFLGNASAVARLTAPQKDFFKSIQGKVNRVRSVRVPRL